MTDHPAIIMDDDRAARVGLDEAVLCEQKSAEQVAQIVGMSRDAGKRRLFTRLAPEVFDALPAQLRPLLEYSAQSRVAVLGGAVQTSGAAKVAIVAAGSSDAPVAQEARATLAFHGHDSVMIADVGVAGLWRLLDRVVDIRRLPVVIAVAGMDAALPTVLAGLVPSLIIGVPCSTGYGVANGGKTALNAMLSSCAPGLTVTNIDNGYGAACAAIRALNAMSGSYSSNSDRSASDSA